MIHSAAPPIEYPEGFNGKFPNQDAGKPGLPERLLLASWLLGLPRLSSLPMKPPLKDGAILITGASAGIGREMARELAPIAKTIVLVARRESRLQELKAELLEMNPKLRVDVQPCDLSDLRDIDRMLDAVHAEVGIVDILINNAGLGDVGLFELTDWEKQEAMIRVNITALTYLMRKLLQPMLDQGRGGILNVSSGYGLTFSPAMAVYVGSKHYVTSFSESIRIELGGTGVVITQLCPGPVETEFLELAGNPTGMDIPKIVSVSARRCARAGLRGFRRGQAIVVPGVLMWVAIWLGRISPRPILRLFYALVGKVFFPKMKQNRD